MRISVGIPFHNAEAYLADAIRSIFAQALQDWELILVDDGSSDGSLQIAQAVRDPRVSLVSDGRNTGLPARLNQIARMARGRYLARMDADDVTHPERLERELSFLEANPEVDVVGTGVYALDAGGRVAGVRSLGPLDPRPEAVLRHGCHVHPTVMGKTSWFRQNPYDVTMARAQDYELWCRTAGTSRFATLPLPLHFYREVGSFSLKKYLASGRSDRRVIRHYGPALVGRLGAASLHLRSRLKGELYRLLVAVGAEDALVRRRVQPLGEQEQAAAEQVLRGTLSTPVPGLPSRV